MKGLKISVSVLLIIAFLTVFSACGKSSAEPMIIELKANQSTGYHWEYKVDDKGLLQVKSEYIQDENPKGFVGVGGKQVYTITPLYPGTTTIRFYYMDPPNINVVSFAEYLVVIDENLVIKEITHTGTYFNKE